MEKSLLKILLIFLCLASAPAIAKADLKDVTSSDIMAEITFLESMLPKRPQSLNFGNAEERAFLNFLSSYAICEGWGFDEYSEFVAVFERDVQQFVPSGRSFQIRLLEESYERRFENGCRANDVDEQVVEVFYSDVGSYFLSVKIQSLVLEAIRARSEEMLRRTIGIYE